METQTKLSKHDWKTFSFSNDIAQQKKAVESMVDYFFKKPEKATNYGGIECLVHLLNNSRDESLLLTSLDILSNLSAQGQFKDILVKSGIVQPLLKLSVSSSTEMVRSVGKALQNISEWRFSCGSKNPNQVRLFNEGVFDLMVKWQKSDNIWFQFVACMTIANLSMNKENANIIAKDHMDSLKRCEDFILVYNTFPKPSLFFNWNVLQPHVPLLTSQFKEIQHFGLFCLTQFACQRSYGERIWQALSLNGGVDIVRELAKSIHEDIRELAKTVLQALNVKQDIEPLYCLKGHDEFGLVFNSREFSDIKFRVGGQIIYAHRVILASKCKLFAAMFMGFSSSSFSSPSSDFMESSSGSPSSWQESKCDVMEISNVSYDVFYEILRYIYTNRVPVISSSNVYQLLLCADMYLLNDLKIQIEHYLEDFVDLDNCIDLIELADQYSCDRLLNYCKNFALYYFDSLSKTERFNSLHDPIKSEIIKERELQELSRLPKKEQQSLSCDAL